MARYLDLSDSQRSSLKNILAQRQQQILAMRRVNAISEAAPTDTFRAIEDQTVQRIRALLDEEQRKKYDPLGVRSSRTAPQQQSVDDWLNKAGPR